MRLSARISAAAILAALAVCAGAPPTSAAATDPAVASAPTTPQTSPAQLWGAKEFDITSKITGRTYRIFLASPLGAPPAAGYPVIYVLDAATAFPTAESQVILASLTGGPPTVVVGVGYPSVPDTQRLRNRDLTPWPADQLALDSDKGAKAEDYGGAEDFHRFMMEELRPIIAKTFPIDPRNQALIGYSLGGLFTLNVMFRHPDAYRTYVAGSPSIWYDGRKVLEGEAPFLDLVRAGKTAPRLLITSDGWEQAEDAPNLPPSGKAREEALANMKVFAMIDNARALAERLKAVGGAPGYEVRYALFPQETHLTGIPASTSRGVTFALYP
jgi:predicted alpha/beta superfamily hydrolase